jgi:HEAT repeat protein
MERVRSLQAVGDVPGLITVLCDESRSGPERRYAAAALGELRDKRAVGPLVSALENPDVREIAVKALVSIGDPVAAAPLAELYASADDRMLRRLAEKALHKLYDKDPKRVRSVLENYERSMNKTHRAPRQGR